MAEANKTLNRSFWVPDVSSFPTFDGPDRAREVHPGNAAGGGVYVDEGLQQINGSAMRCNGCSSKEYGVEPQGPRTGSDDVSHDRWSIRIKKRKESKKHPGPLVLWSFGLFVQWSPSPLVAIIPFADVFAGHVYFAYAGA